MMRTVDIIWPAGVFVHYASPVKSFPDSENVSSFVSKVPTDKEKLNCCSKFVIHGNET